MKFFNQAGNCRGQSLVELLVVIGLLAIFLPVVLTSLITSREGKSQEYQRLKALTLLTEASEALRYVGSSSWSYISTNGTYFPQQSGSSWELVSGTESVDGFSRSITISSIQRDSNGLLTEVGGEEDPSSKKVVVTVAWNTPYDSSISTTLMLSRHNQNQSLTQTTEQAFSGGTSVDTEVTNNEGGEVQLRGDGHNFQSSGEFTSDTFDSGANVGFNNLSWTATQSDGQQIRFQVATNTDNSSWNYLGPDGTESSYFTSSPVAIPLSLGGRYLRYKAFFTSNGNSTPVLKDVSINYSP